MNPSTTVLERVLQRLREAEVHGSLHVGIEAPGGADLDVASPGNEATACLRAEPRPPSCNAVGDAAGEVA